MAGPASHWFAQERGASRHRRLIDVAASGALVFLLMTGSVQVVHADIGLDSPFSAPQYIVHAIGHGTTSGGVADDFYTLLNGPPDANGRYTIPDGSGGTIGYQSDFHAGPFNTPRGVCDAAAARGLGPSRRRK